MKEAISREYNPHLLKLNSMRVFRVLIQSAPRDLGIMRPLCGRSTTRAEKRGGIDMISYHHNRALRIVSPRARKMLISRMQGADGPSPREIQKRAAAEQFVVYRCWTNLIQHRLAIGPMPRRTTGSHLLMRKEK